MVIAVGGRGDDVTVGDDLHAVGDRLLGHVLVVRDADRPLADRDVPDLLPSTRGQRAKRGDDGDHEHDNDAESDQHPFEPWHEELPPC